MFRQWGLITLGYSVGDEPVAPSGAITLIDSGTSNNFIPRAAAAARASLEAFPLARRTLTSWQRSLRQDRRQALLD